MRVVVLRPGATRPERKTKPAVLAPDGAPVSTLLMSQQTWPLVEVVFIHNPTRRVKIEKRRFNPVLHRIAPPAPPPAKARKGTPREKPNYSAEPESELLTWTLAKLKTLPEYLFVIKPADDKMGLVKQLLRVRERA